MAVFYELGTRIVLRLHGAAALKFLNDVSTQEVAELRPGQCATTAFLTDKGRILAIARVLASEDGAYLVAEEACAAGLERAVTRVAPLAGVEVEESRWQALGFDGDVGLSKPKDEASWADSSGGILMFDEFVAPSVKDGEEHLIAAGATRDDLDDVEAKRIAAGIPRYGVDVDEDTHINETPLLEQAVSFTKGCYPGQESVARIRNLGRVKRMLRVLVLDGSATRNDDVLVEGESVGRITSAAHGRAFAVMSSDVTPGTAVTVSDLAGTVAS